MCSAKGSRRGSCALCMWIRSCISWPVQPDLQGPGMKCIWHVLELIGALASPPTAKPRPSRHCARVRVSDLMRESDVGGRARLGLGWGRGPSAVVCVRSVARTTEGRRVRGVESSMAWKVLPYTRDIY
jgi:hypothetical protein